MNMIAIYIPLSHLVFLLTVRYVRMIAYMSMCLCWCKRESSKKDIWNGIVKLLSSVLQADYLQEASLLMAKLCYVEGEYRDALGNSHALLLWFIYSFLVFVQGFYYSKSAIDCVKCEPADLFRSLQQGEPGWYAAGRSSCVQAVHDSGGVCD